MTGGLNRLLAVHALANEIFAVLGEPIYASQHNIKLEM
jgi:hypothetical protein